MVRDRVGSFCNYKAPKFLTLFGLDLISRINAIQALILSSRSIMYELSRECMLASLIKVSCMSCHMNACLLHCSYLAYVPKLMMGKL